MPVRTLLLTDLVDSTRLAAEIGDAAVAELWARHDRLARDLLAAHGGREIDKSDGFLLLFDTPEAAGAFAGAYHGALRTLGVRARAGMHTGEVLLRENPAADVARGAKPLEVEGLAKSIAARVMGVAQGGQTLATRAAAPADARSHGTWRLKGAPEPLELFEVHGDGHPPPDGPKAWRVVWRNDAWIPARDVPHALPAERDPFVGRAEDLAALERRLDEGARLVTILGIGGTGKTRLAVHHAWTWLGDWPGGAWFCDLSEARDADGIARAVGATLGVPLAEEDAVGRLGHAIAGRGRCLVILDNFEQVSRHAAETVGRWLDRAGEAAFVVTTREVLGLRGEHALALAPLSQDDAVALFDARARAAARDLSSDPASVARLVELLDRLPLAIELAAARARLMTPAQMLERIGDRFRLLAASGARRDRQATLRSTLDWSWGLLDPEEQSALAQLSVFEGGFTLDAAEAVLALDTWWAADAVQGLVDKSLVRRVGADRLDLLVSVQAYAAEKLAAREVVEVRHGAWYAAHPADRDLDNLVAACRRATLRGDAPQAAAALRGAWDVIRRIGPLATALELAAGVASMPTTTGAQRCEALKLQGLCLGELDRPDERRARFEEALALATAAGDLALQASLETRLATDDAALDLAMDHARASGRPEVEAEVLEMRGRFASKRGEERAARGHFEAALALYRQTTDLDGQLQVTLNLGNTLEVLGELDAARSCLEGGLALARQLEDRILETTARGNLGILELEQRRYAVAIPHLEAAVRGNRALGRRTSEATALTNLGLALGDAGRVDEARDAFTRSARTHEELGDHRGIGRALANLGRLESNLGRPQVALDRYAEALAHAEAAGDHHLVTGLDTNVGSVLLELGRHDEARPILTRALEAHRSRGSRRFEAITLSNLAEVHQRDGDFDEATRLLTQARASFEALGDGVYARATVVSQARVLEARGRPDEAVAALDDVAAELSGGWEAQAELLRGRIALARGDGAAAWRHLERAEETRDADTELAAGLERLRARLQGVRRAPADAYLDPARRRSLLALLDDGFPGLSARITAARADGFAWEDVTEPFVVWEGDDAVAHVGVIEHRIRLDGRDLVCAGLHAVVTRADRRGRGLARRCLADALAWVDDRYGLAKLGTDLPAVYAPHGFRPLVLHRFEVDHAGGEGRGRPVGPADRARLLDLLPVRAPVSDRFASLDPGWLVGLDLALGRRALADLQVLDALGVVVDWDVRDGVLRLHDVFAANLPPLADLLALAPPHERAALYCCPDLLAPDARPVPMPEAGVWMVRGDWPLDARVPIGISRLAEH